MTHVLDIIARLRAHAEGLPDAHCRPEFGNQVLYVGGTQFAALTDRAVLLHLPAAELTDVLRRRVARPFVSAGAMGKNRWVEIGLDSVPIDELERLLEVAHRSGRQAHRRTRKGHPSRARRRTGPSRFA